MQKTLKIEGMTCGHCKMKVENTLNGLSRINSAEVDLIDGTCDLELSEDIDNEELTRVISEAGYQLTKVN